MTERQYPILGMVGGGLVVLGSLLPWATVGLISIAGTSGDGIITLVLGAVVALAAYLRYGGNQRGYVKLIPFVLGLGIGYIGVSDALNLGGSMGIGLWVVILGAVAAIIGSGSGRLPA